MEKLFERLCEIYKTYSLVFSLVIATFLLIPISTASADDGLPPELSDIEVKFDLNQGSTQEEEIYSESGEYLGTLGIEMISHENEVEGENSIFNTYPAPTGNSTWRIYWTAVACNLEYYVDVHRPSTGNLTFTNIRAAYDERFNFVLPLYVQSDALRVLHRQENATTPSKARYRIIYGPGSLTIDLNAKFQLHYLYTSLSM